MSFPPPPPSNQPPYQPPQGESGGFGPPGGGYGPGGQQPGPGGYGAGGHGPSAPPPGQSPPGPYGAPAGGFGPPAPGGPGGWQQPPAPPSRGGNGTAIALIIGAGVLVVAVVIGCVIWANSGDGGRTQARPGTGASASATPSASGSGAPTPSASATPTGPGSSPSASTGRTAPFYTLKTGDCFDIPPGGNGGNNRAASCNGPHDAEVVFVYTLPRGLTSENEIKDKASALCSIELPDKAAKQPAGTAGGTYVQFPTVHGYQLGVRSVVCSLTGSRSGTKKLTKPLV